MNLSNLKPAEGSTKTRKRIGRGPGSGLGGTSTRDVYKRQAKRAELKAAGDYEALQALPKNASPVRLHNRCKITLGLCPVLGQQPVDAGDGLLIISGRFQPGDVVGQAHIQAADSFIPVV